jgi:hypothetical protein
LPPSAKRSSVEHHCQLKYKQNSTKLLLNTKDRIQTPDHRFLKFLTIEKQN